MTVEISKRPPFVRSKFFISQLLVVFLDTKESFSTHRKLLYAGEEESEWMLSCTVKISRHGSAAKFFISVGFNNRGIFQIRSTDLKAVIHTKYLGFGQFHYIVN